MGGGGGGGGVGGLWISKRSHILMAEDMAESGLESLPRVFRFVSSFSSARYYLVTLKM